VERHQRLFQKSLRPAKPKSSKKKIRPDSKKVFKAQ
jgi:hypothetical protein